MAEQIKPPLFFPCANRVTLPQVGADETKLTPRRTIALETPMVKVKQLPDTVSKDYLKKVSLGISFSEDVVKDRCFHLLPYDTKFHQGAYDFGDIVSVPPRIKVANGRHNQRGSDNRHMPCHIEKRASHRLKPMKRPILKKAAEMHKEALDREKKGHPSSSEDSATTSSTKETTMEATTETTTETTTQPTATEHNVFLTEVKGSSQDEVIPSPPQTPVPSQQVPGKKADWDCYLLTRLSENTAQWLVKRQMSAGPHKDQLQDVIETYHGPMAEGDVELIKDTVSELDFPIKTEHRAEKWRKGDETLLDRVREITLAKAKPTDPYSDDTGAAFYRLPAGFRRAKKHKDREEEGAINTTAFDIEVTTYEAPPLKTLKDVLNPEAGKTVYDSDNMFVQEWLIGQDQIYQPFGDKTNITMDSDNKYRKVLQRESPQKSAGWYKPEDQERRPLTSDGKSPVKFERGLHRWTGLPEPIDDTADNLGMVAMDSDGEIRTGENKGKPIKTPSGTILVQIVDDWRGKWHLDMRYADASPDDLIRDMADLHPHIRLKAITTCARAAEYRPPPKPGIQLDETHHVKQSKLLPEELFVALEICLEDSHEQVARAAAIALYTLERPAPKAEDILRETLKDEKSADRWTAAQCLAYYGECDSDVVGELVTHLLNTEDIIRHDQAARLLTRLSENSTLVHSMLAEQLNSTSWRHRCMACRVIPKLSGQINKDLASKLTQLMWGDWHTEVRKAAAQTLGRTGHGKDVHDELRERILSGNERTRVEAVSRVGQLGIMTAKLMPAFLQCFTDNYVSVRMETCISCSNLKIGEQQFVERLVYLATYDPIWKVKALALQAIGKLGVVTEAVRECILWSFRYEDQEGVRAEACHTITMLQMQDDEVAQMLQDRYLVEPSTIVKEEISLALGMCGILPTEDMDMVARVKMEVRKLCTRNNICAQITLDEKEEAKKKNLERMIFLTPEDKATKDADEISAVPSSSNTPSDNKHPVTKSVAFQPQLQKRATSGRSEARNLRSLKLSMAAKSRAQTASSSKSDGSSTYSREHTALTPVADREVAVITGRESVTPTSRPDTAFSLKSQTSHSLAPDRDEGGMLSPTKEEGKYDHDLEGHQPQATKQQQQQQQHAQLQHNVCTDENHVHISELNTRNKSDIVATSQPNASQPPAVLPTVDEIAALPDAIAMTSQGPVDQPSHDVQPADPSTAPPGDHDVQYEVPFTEPSEGSFIVTADTSTADAPILNTVDDQSASTVTRGSYKLPQPVSGGPKPNTALAADASATKSGAVTSKTPGSHKRRMSRSRELSREMSREKSREKKKSDPQEINDPETAVSKYSGSNASGPTS